MGAALGDNALWRAQLDGPTAMLGRKNKMAPDRSVSPWLTFGLISGAQILFYL